MGNSGFVSIASIVSTDHALACTFVLGRDHGACSTIETETCLGIAWRLFLPRGRVKLLRRGKQWRWKTGAPSWNLHTDSYGNPARIEPEFAIDSQRELAELSLKLSLLTTLQIPRTALAARVLAIRLSVLTEAGCTGCGN